MKLDFLIHIVYNRFKKEKTLKDSRIAMFLVKKEKKLITNQQC